MKWLWFAVLVISLLQVNGFFSSKKKDKCPSYGKFENSAIACMMPHEAAFKTKDPKTQCKAYRESTTCMAKLGKTMKDCGFMAPVDVYEQMAGWEHLQKTDLCRIKGY